MVKLFCYLLVFLFVFGMNIPILEKDINVFINILLLILLPFLNRGRYLISTSIMHLFVLLLVDLLIVMLVPVFYGTYDFSMLSTKVNFYITIFNLYQICVFLHHRYEDPIYELVKSFLFITMLQSLIIIYSLLNSSFAKTIGTLSKSANDLERMFDIYGGARGLGFTSYSAFGLAIIYSVLLIVLFYAHSKKYINTTVLICMLLSVLVAGASAGRSYIIGFVLGIIPLINTKKFFIFILGSVLILSYLLTIDINTIENNTLSLLYQYSLEPILNYIETGHFTTTSTAALEKMYFPLTVSEVFIGDGYYTDPITNSYYKGTDAGYMRFILYYGAIVSTFFYCIFIYFGYSVVNSIRNDKASRYLLTAFILSAFVLHYKGEVILFASGFNKIIIPFFMLFSLKNAKRINRIRLN